MPAAPASLGHWLAANADLERIDAELLAARVLGAGRAQVVAFPERELTSSQIAVLERLASRVRQREPLAYVLGEREFFGCSFQVDENVLVPRPETELLVELAVRLAPLGGRVLDLGAGSGCIAVALKAKRPDLTVFATDICGKALQVAARNAARHNARIAFAQSDWLAGLRGPFDCIVANPPYIPAGHPDLAALRREPQLALVAGPEGLDAIQRIIGQAARCLTARGCLILEHGSNQASAVQAQLAAQGWRNAATHCDLAGRERATLAWKSPQGAGSLQPPAPIPAADAPPGPKGPRAAGVKAASASSG